MNGNGNLFQHDLEEDRKGGDKWEQNKQLREGMRDKVTQNGKEKK
jgi:hypothetical protein